MSTLYKECVTPSYEEAKAAGMTNVIVTTPERFHDDGITLDITVEQAGEAEEPDIAILDLAIPAIDEYMGTWDTVQ